MQISKLQAIGLALSVASALSVLVSATAFGASKGELINEAGGTVKGKITLVQKTALVVESLAGIKVTCQEASGEGEAVSTTQFVSKNGAFKRCVKSTGGTCKSKGAAPEEIRLGQLNILIVTNTAGTEDLGVTELVNEPEAECAEVKVKLRAGGKFLSRVSPQGSFAKIFTLWAQCSSSGMQELTKYKEAGVEKTISEAEGFLTKIGSGAFEGTCHAGEGTATLAEEGELI